MIISVCCGSLNGEGLSDPEAEIRSRSLEVGRQPDEKGFVCHNALSPKTGKRAVLRTLAGESLSPTAFSQSRRESREAAPGEPSISGCLLDAWKTWRHADE